jgi:hypothetical protein
LQRLVVLYLYRSFRKMVLLIGEELLDAVGNVIEFEMKNIGRSLEFH